MILLIILLFNINYKSKLNLKKKKIKKIKNKKTNRK